PHVGNRNGVHVAGVVVEVVAGVFAADAVVGVKEVLGAGAEVPAVGVGRGADALRLGLDLLAAVADAGEEVGVGRQRQEADAVERDLVVELGLGGEVPGPDLGLLDAGGGFALDAEILAEAGAQPALDGAEIGVG